MVTSEWLFEQAMELDEADREALAERLYASLERVDPDWEGAWLKEIERRDAEHAAGRNPEFEIDLDDAGSIDALERRMADYRSGLMPGIPLEEAKPALFGPRPGK